MVDFVRWNRLLSIEEPVYRDVTLEVLSILEVDRRLIGFSRPEDIQFHIYDEPQGFFVDVELYNIDFIVNQ